jgi:hypothetical protein
LSLFTCHLTDLISGVLFVPLTCARRLYPPATKAQPATRASRSVSATSARSRKPGAGLSLCLTHPCLSLHAFPSAPFFVDAYSYVSWKRWFSTTSERYTYGNTLQSLRGEYSCASLSTTVRVLLGLTALHPCRSASLFQRHASDYAPSFSAMSKLLARIHHTVPFYAPPTRKSPTAVRCL